MTPIPGRYPPGSRHQTRPRRPARAGKLAGVALLTVGHGNLGQDDLGALLTGTAVEVVTDVRRVPGSRRHPHVARAAIERWLTGAGVAYRWEPRLGGWRRPRPDSPNTALRLPAFRGYADHMAGPEFRAALDEVLALAARRTTAVMCSEAVWWRCHRRLLADFAVAVRGAEVLHLGHDGRLLPHRLTEGLRVEGDGLVYDVGAQPALGPLA